MSFDFDTTDAIERHLAGAPRPTRDTPKATMTKPFRTAPMKDGIRYDSRGEPIRDTPEAAPSRYELLHDDPRFGLAKGDVLICGPMHWAWAHEKVAVLRRESDGYEPGCSRYRSDVRYLSGPRS